MSNKDEKIRKICDQFRKENENKPFNIDEVVVWAVNKKLLDLPEINNILEMQFKKLHKEVYDVVSNEYGLHNNKKYRKNRVVKTDKKDGTSGFLWDSVDTCSRDHMWGSVKQQREQVVSEMLQMKIDVDVWNDIHQNEELIQLVLDFTDDIAEREVQ